MKWIVTGGAGFIGSHFARYAVKRGIDVTVVDALTYAGNLANLDDLRDHERFSFVHTDITDRSAIGKLFENGADAVINFAAETHVDRSITQPDVFVRTNVIGTQVLLDYACECHARFLQVSTDEVYGSLDVEGKFCEDTLLVPSSPYSASKAAADLMVLAYTRTYDLDAVITRCSNNYGSHQFPEKFIPQSIICALTDQPVRVYGDGLNVRDWLHVNDHCSALHCVLQNGASGQIYNIGGNNEHPNIEIAHQILDVLQKPYSVVQYVGDRPGHDRRYAIDASKLHSLGWEASVDFPQGLSECVDWYCEHKAWWQSILKNEYRGYYAG